jgi:hypothetical protein
MYIELRYGRYEVFTLYIVPRIISGMCKRVCSIWQQMLYCITLVEQDTIECVSVAYLKFIIKFLRTNLYFSCTHFMQFFSADATIYLEKESKFLKKFCP